MHELFHYSISWGSDSLPDRRVLAVHWVTRGAGSARPAILAHALSYFWFRCTSRALVRSADPDASGQAAKQKGLYATDHSIQESDHSTGHSDHDRSDNKEHGEVIGERSFGSSRVGSLR